MVLFDRPPRITRVASTEQILLSFALTTKPRDSHYSIMRRPIKSQNSAHWKWKTEQVVFHGSAENVGRENDGHEIEGHKSTPIRKMSKIKAEWA